MRSPLLHLVFSTVVFSVVRGQVQTRNLGLNIGAVCDREGSKVWTCKLPRNCPQAGDIRVTRPEICGFEDRDPIICCPPGNRVGNPTTQPPQQNSNRKAAQMCRIYELTCLDGVEEARFRRSLQFFRKRKTTPKPAPLIEMTTSSTIVFEPEGGPVTHENLVTDDIHARAESLPTEHNSSTPTSEISAAEVLTPPPNTVGETPSEETRVNSTEITTEEGTPRVIGGRMARPRTHPYMALIGYGNQANKDWRCGGSLISERYVLSAAHCARFGNVVARWVRLGELDYSTNSDDANPRDFQITNRVVHPQYKEPQVYNDIALFKLNRAVEFSAYIRPVCLHTVNVIPAKRATATGWGRVDFIGDTSPALQEVDLTLWSGDDCKRNFASDGGSQLPRGVNANTMVCAGEKEGGKDTCSGDSGGPLVIQETNKCLKTQIGITSFGRQCGLANSPAVYTRVSAFIPWIESVVWPN